MEAFINYSYSKTIYKKDSKNKLRYLKIYNQGAELIQVSGVLGSPNPIEHRSTCVAKNVGRANATTPEQQAVLEAQSKITAKLTEGYFETIDAAKTEILILPMLAKVYKDECHKIDWTGPVFAQPKLDGMRALGTPNKPMLSRQGKVIETMGHIQEELDTLATGFTFDGELYCHGKNFQETMRLIKKDRGKETKQIKYRVYDMVLSTVPFNKRYAILLGLVKDLKTIEIVPTYPIKDEEELKTLHKKFLAEGYEGTIIRHGTDGYAIDTRATQLLKYKDFLDIAAEIVNVVPSEKNPLQGVIQCKIPTGTFGCGMKFSHAEREEILKNKAQYIGKMAEIRFFEYSEDGIPRFPVCYGIRLDR